MDEPTLARKHRDDGVETVDDRVAYVRDDRTTSIAPAPGPGPVAGEVVEEGGARIVSEDERVRTLADGTVVSHRDRVEHEPPRRRVVGGPATPLALAVLVLALLGTLAAAWYLTQDEQVAVPDVVGLQESEAVAALGDEGLESDVTGAPSDEPLGTVLEQSPAAGTEVDDGVSVGLVVADEAASLAVPNLVGVAEVEARDRLAAAGLGVNAVEVFSDEPEGTVVAQEPAAGAKVDPDTVVRVNVSKGEGTTIVPSLVGQQRDTAEAALTEAGLQANVVEVPSDEPVGTVVAQSPDSGEVRAGSAIRLNVSAGR